MNRTRCDREVVVFRTQTSTCLLWVMTMLSCCTHLTAPCRGHHRVSTNSEVEWNDIPICVDRHAPFSPFHALLSGFVWVERCILLISASATHWSLSVLAPFTSCTVLPSFDLHSNRKAKGMMSFFCGLQTHLCVSLFHLHCLASQIWMDRKKNTVIISA